MQTRTYLLIFTLLLTINAVGCSGDTEPKKTFNTSDVEQLLLDHPELNVPEDEDAPIPGT